MGKGALASTSIVVVAQNLFMTVRLTDALHNIGYKGCSVRNEAELRVMLAKERPLLVILDLQAPGVLPHAVVATAREAVPGQVIPVLAFGPHADAGKRAAALGAGCQRVVLTSMIVSELAQLVQGILRS